MYPSGNTNNPRHRAEIEDERAVMELGAYARGRFGVPTQAEVDEELELRRVEQIEREARS